NSGLFLGPRTVTWPDLNAFVPLTGYVNSAYDNFNRANGAIGSNWTTGITGAFTISGNQALGPGGTSHTTAAYNAGTFVPGANLFAQATIATLSTAAGVDLMISGGNAYACRETTTTLDLLKVTGTFSAVTLATTAVTGAVGDVLRLELGNTGNMTCTRL